MRWSINKSSTSAPKSECGGLDDGVFRYGKDPNHVHHYLMSIGTKAFIDATKKGNISRFINHSCDPNAETQKVGVSLLE